MAVIGAVLGCGGRRGREEGGQGAVGGGEAELGGFHGLPVPAFPDAAELGHLAPGADAAQEAALEGPALGEGRG